MKNRILIISHNPFSEISNNGKTLEAIFSKFKKEELFQLYFVDDANADKNYAQSYFFTSDNDAIKLLLKKRKQNTITKKTSDHKIPNFQKEEQKKESRLVSFLKKHNHSLSIFRDFLWQVAKPEKSKEIKNWIKEVNPNFIFFVGGNQVFSHEMVKNISLELNVKYGVFFTDDYILYPLHNNFLKKIQHKRLQKEYLDTVEKASICFAIGNMMCEEYQHHFKKPFFPIMNMVDVRNPIIQETHNEKFTISYFGGLHLNRWQMLSEFGKELDTDKIILQVFTGSPLTTEIQKSFQEANIVFKGSVKDEDLKKEIANSDGLIHVESDEPEYRALTKLSVSTKIPEYLNTNKLVIAYGPSDIASIRLIADHGIGLVIHDKKDIRPKIGKILDNLKQITILSEKARNFASTKFDIEKLSSEFKKTIENTIHHS